MGWLVQATDYRKLNEPPRPRLQRNGTIYLMARPPLLCQGGVFAFSSRLYQTPVPRGRLVGNAQPPPQEGVAASSKKIWRSHRSRRSRGGFPFGFIGKPPRPRDKRMLRDIF